MKKKFQYQLLCCTVLIFLNLAFIWGNSLLPGSESSELSGGVVVWLEEVVGHSLSGSEYLIRKLAHFSEFAGLGLWLAWLFGLLKQRGFHRFTMPLLFGSLAALTDETLQVLTPERGPSVVDVWIDTAGVATGILVVLLICRISESRRKHLSNGGN